MFSFFFSKFLLLVFRKKEEKRTLDRDLYLTFGGSLTFSLLDGLGTDWYLSVHSSCSRKTISCLGLMSNLRDHLNFKRSSDEGTLRNRALTKFKEKILKREVKRNPHPSSLETLNCGLILHFAIVYHLKVNAKREKKFCT